MQMMADVMNMPIRIHQFRTNLRARRRHVCSNGSRIFIRKVEDAMAAMGQGFDKTFSPDH